MSNSLRAAAYELGPRMRQLLEGVPVERRVAPERAHHVAVLLADRYQDRRGYVDETVDQIEKCCAFGSVKRILQALHEANIWRRVDGHRGGSRAAGSRRIPGTALTDLVTVSRDEVQARPRHGESPTSSRYDPDLVTVSRDAPLHPLSTPAQATNGDTPTIDAVIDRAVGMFIAHKSANGFTPNSPTAYARTVRRDADDHRDAVARWLGEHRDPARVALAVVSRLTGENPHASPPKAT